MQQDILYQLFNLKVCLFEPDRRSPGKNTQQQNDLLAEYFSHLASVSKTRMIQTDL